MRSGIRTKLFLSYSKGDADWRDMFLRHLKTMVSFEDGLWLDQESIGDGADWKSSLANGLTDSKCALMLLTPNYLTHGRFANDVELPMLLEEQGRGLRLLPVLVEPCSWDQHPELADLQFVKWRNDTRSSGGESPREEPRAICEAAMEEQSEAVIKYAVNQAVLEVCERVRRDFGVVGQITGPQRAAIPEQTVTALEVGNQLTLEEEIHSGEFTLIYRGKYRGRTAAVKVLPTAVWRNRVDSAFAHAMSALDDLRDGSFIRVKDLISNNPDVHAIVMEYVDWPTLGQVLVGHPGRRLPPRIVAALLSRISAAQHEAHRCGMQLGALSAGSIYVNREWEVRLSPIRIEAQLAQALTLSTGQLVNWDVLAMLTPEVYAGLQPVTLEDLDAQGQYYLGLLGLELLLGRKPVEISCFQDLAAKVAFFDDPRAFFDDPGPLHRADGAARWTEDSPALAFVLATMLARNPADRLRSADVVTAELRCVAEDRLPGPLRRCLEADVHDVVSDAFGARFYRRLFALRPGLAAQFSDQAAQAGMLAGAVRDLVEFRREDSASRFLDLVRVHHEKHITAADVEAFRQAFVAEVVETCGEGVARHPARVRGDAWNAALRLGLGVMLDGLGPVDGAAGR